NSGTNSVSLDGLYLSTNYTSLTSWAFPTGHVVNPGQFLVVFCDSEPGETTSNEAHTDFRLAAISGSIALSRLFTNAPQVMDYVNYAGLHVDRSYGSYPDGQPFDRQEFFYVTPGGTNDGRAAPLTVFINEWMAGNTSTLADPADGNFEDWFELYNPATHAVDLAGYYLSDSSTNAAGVVTNKFQFLITTNMAHLIPAQGYLLVWADNETGQNLSAGVPRPDLHVSFALSLGGEAIGLFAADGMPIDRVTFGPQTNNVSRGRFPDGAPDLYFMPTSVSPRAANYLPGFSNAAPVLTSIGNKAIYMGQTLAFTATATDSDLPAQALTFSLDPTPPAGASISGAGAFSWTPAGVGASTITIRVSDNGVPAKSDFESILVEVLALDFTSSVRNGNNLELTWGTRAGKSYAVDYKADLNTENWTALWTNTATGNSLSFTNGTTAPPQGFFRIRTVQ
ncbi:MAG TPA: lamin tail domain-containing protein, partial [Candidatus Acidoferrum sp.]|nr:lamin tail domain-containing protein [Candidatus Acidoferrum sp.]